MNMKFKSTSLVTFFISRTDLKQFAALHHYKASDMNFMYRATQGIESAEQRMNREDSHIEISRII